MKLRCLLITLLILCLSACALADQLDGGAKMESAAVISTDIQYIGSMSTEAEAWYTFRAEEGSAYYRASFKNEDIGTSLYMTLMDASGIKLEEENVNKQSSTSISWKAEPGAQYYLKFRRYSKDKSGRFTLSLTRTPDEYGNTAETAGSITLDKTVLSSFDGTGDKDFLVFTTEAGQAYYRIDLKNESIASTAYMTLLDENQLKVAEVNATKGGSDYISWLAEPLKTYYLQFRPYDKYKCGAYTVTLSRKADDHGQNFETAVALPLDETLQASIDGSNDSDYFVFTIPEGQAYYRADFRNEGIASTLYMTLYDENQLKLVEANASKSNDDYLSWFAEPGKTYYLQFRPYDRVKTGTYTLSLARRADNEGNDIASATDVVMNTQRKASFDGTDDVDMFRLTAGEGDLFYSVPMTNESIGSTLYLTLLDANGLKLNSIDASKGYTSTLSWQAEPGAVYYLQFTRYDRFKTGEYNFTVNEIVDNEPDTLSNELPILAGASAAYTLGSKDDTDWFCVAAPEAASFVTLTVANEGGDTLRTVFTDANGKETDNYTTSRGKSRTVNLYMTPDAPIYLCVTGKVSGSYTIARQDTVDVGGSSTADALSLTPGTEATLIFEQDNDTDYAAFPGIGANILVTASGNSSFYVSVMDAHGQRLSDEYRVRSGGSRLLTADRADVYVCLRGSGSAVLTSCTAEAHTPTGTWVMTRPATCAEKGEEVMLCTVCSQPAQVNALPETGHVPADAYMVAKPAGCDDMGREELYCVICSTLMDQRSIPAAGHQNTYWNIVLEATCEAEGLQRRLCADCGKQLDQERLPASGHFAGTPMVTQATCYAQGRTQTSCRLCGQVLEETVTPATPHTPGVKSLIYGAGCESEGLEETPCAVCYAVLEQHPIPATGHAYGPWVQTVAPTTNAEGVEESTCANCGAVQTRPVAKLSFLQGIFGR